MLSLKKMAILFLSILATVGASGCAEKAFFPAVDIEITGVTPYELTPTTTDSASLPRTTVSIRSLSKIPSTLKSYSIDYATRLGEPLPGASSGLSDIEVKIEPESTVELSLRPYSLTIVNLFDSSFSNISPVKARITLNFQDVNGNWVSRNANCLLHKLE